MSVVDTARVLETPEGVALMLRPAGLPSRALAWAIDLSVRATVWSVAFIPAIFLGEAGLGLLFLFAFLMEWFYPVAFEVLWGGRTPGKAAVGLLVVHDDGTPVGVTASLLRNLLRVADFLPFAWAGGALCMLSHPDGKRLGDLGAGTLVVYADRPPRLVALPDVEALRPPVTLSPEERLALLAYARRSPAWSGDRAEELAELLADLVGVRGPAAVRRLWGMARHVAGGKDP